MGIKTAFQTVFHGAITFVYFCTILEYQRLPPMPHKKDHEHFAGCWKFLTFWNLVVQFSYFAFAFGLDFMKTSSSNYQKLAKQRDKFYAGIVMPYGLFVVAVFWILYSINRELIFPKVLDGIFPAWLNHTSHTAILPALLLESYMVKHKYPKRKDGVTITAAFGLAYVVWVLYLALAKEIWPYPILYLLNWGQRVIFFGAGMTFITLMYIIAEKINSCFWGELSVSKTK